MLREDIARALPEGVGQPLMSRLLTARTPGPWIRAGELRRVGEELVFTPRWDGQAFAALWDAAPTARDEDTTPRVEFAIHRDGRLQLIAKVPLDRRLTLDASQAQRDAQRDRRAWRPPRR